MSSSPRRAFGFWICLALVVGNMIGSGVFAMPAALARFGWNSAIAWLVTIAGTLCLAFVFSRLARAFPSAGGPYAYTREAFGHAPSFAVAWSYWVSILAANAAISLTTVSYLSHFFPIFTAAPGMVAILFVWSLTAISCLSLRGAGDLQVLTTLLKLLPLAAAMLLVFMILGGAAPAAPPDPPIPLSAGAIASTATLTLWAMVGFEAATIPAEHIRDPQRTIPRATMIGTVFTGLVYLVACTGVALLLPREVAVHSNAPFADFIGRYWGPGPASMVAAFAAISTLGALNGWILLQGELPRAMAADGVFPRWFASISKAQTPVRAQLASSLIITLLLIVNQGATMIGLIEFMALVSTIASLVAYLACAAAALKLQVERRIERSSVLVGASALGLVYASWAVYGAGLKPLLLGLALILSGLPVYLSVRLGRPAAATGEA